MKVKIWTAEELLNAEFMSTNEVARYLQYGKDTILRWAKDGVIPAHRDGYRWCFEKQEIDAWLKTNPSVYPPYAPG